ncbi:M20/M25/M40 family metallo-hydrolase [Aquirufa sp. ROCK-SH2]
MKVRILFLIALVFPYQFFGQSIDKLIRLSETERIEKYLSSDELEGRKPFTPGIEKAAQFISKEFEKNKLDYFSANSYLQTFQLYKPSLISAKLKLENVEVVGNKMVVFTRTEKVTIDENSGYTISSIKKGDNLFRSVYQYLSKKSPQIVFVDESFSTQFSRLSNRNPLKKNQETVVFILSDVVPAHFKIEAVHSVTPLNLSNVVAMIPGKSLTNEYVIFSGHYDHLGIISKGGSIVDSIYNGANDDAAGTTAMIMLAKYFKKKNNNERTLLFVAFTAEESGGFGSSYFSEQLNPESVKAMFNLEMIGTESKWGKNSAYITGFDKSNMGQILQENLKGTAFTFYPDPYTDQNLFYRSDNATLARLGVPAHTISTSKMDSEPNYHQASDEYQTLDLVNMNEIIKAIAKSSESIISGKDTPSRVDTLQLK